MLATYMRRMRNNKLEVRIVGSSSRPQYVIAKSLKPYMSFTRILVGEALKALFQNLPFLISHFFVAQAWPVDPL